MRKVLFFGFLFLTSLVSMAQVPIINNVTPLTSYPQNKILITGSGFSSTPSQLQVWFDQVKGTITASTEFSIEVTAPAQARVSNIEVINLSSKFSSRSLSKFVPFYHGDSFNEALFLTPTANVTTFSSGAEESFDVCSCDFDGDGKPDLASSKNSQLATSTVLLLKNTSTPGNLSFTSQSSVVFTGTTFNITCGDLNGDGMPDLVASRANTGFRNQVFLFKNTSTLGTISFSAPTSIFLDPGENAIKPIIRDMNLDGKSDLIFTNSANKTVNPVYVFRNTSVAGSISFAPFTKILITGATTTYGLDAQDLDGDLKPEIIINQFTGPDLFIVKNNSSVGELSFSSTIQKIALPGSLNQLTTADFNKDGKLDIAVTSSFDDFLYVLSNQSSGGTISFGTPAQFVTGDSPWGIDVSDIDGDEDVDIIVGNRGVSETTISVFKNSGGATPTFTKVSIATGKKSRNVRVGDLDGDAKPDIAFTTDTGNSVDILRNKNCFSPPITNETPLTICTGQTIKLNSIPSPGTTFTWKEGSTTFKTSVDSFADITTTGSYTVTATSEGGACAVQSAVLNVTSSLGAIPADPVINPVTPVCSGQTLNLTTPTIAGVTYEWTGPNSFTSTLQNPTIPNVSAANAGLYTLQLQVATPGTCKTNITSARVDIANMANFAVSSSVASNSVCQGLSITLSVNGTFGHTYQWIKGSTDIGGQTSQTLSVTEDGAYKVRVTNTTLGCSIETTPITVNVLTIPVSTFTPSTLATCVNRNVTFTNQSTGDSRATMAYLWDFGDGTSSTDQSPAKTYTTAASRNVQLTVSYSGVPGCTNLSTKAIVVSTAQVPVVNATINPICTDETSVLSVTGTFNEYEWTGPATGSTSTLDITKPGTYAVNTTEANGCTANAQIIITTKPAATLTVTADEKPVASGSDLTVVANSPVQLLASGADSYSWAPPDGLDNPAIANPKLTPIEEVTYTVTGSKTGLCNGVYTFNIKLDPNGDSFFPPNAFSPNGDGNNDFWIIPGSQNYMDCTLSIFNKQGSKVFEQKGYTNTWDGTFDGKDLPQGTYYYVLTCPDKKPVTGNVLLAR